MKVRKYSVSLHAIQENELEVNTDFLNWSENTKVVCI